ncbi:MAG: histidine phosphatase family protein [Candidatus Nanopelagicales bacterium]|nr:histidine phosphatase family protein [Candidatus Nanopelagicales bacterium]
MSTDRTTVHLVRHGEVHNPTKILYGRLSDYHLSELGLKMADRVADWMASRDLVALWSSPLDRARETASPIAVVTGLPVRTDQRLLEATNVFEGQRVSVGDGVLGQPKAWRHLWNPFRPSWGEPYQQVAARMRDAVLDARNAAFGHEIAVVSHQLPIWVTRLSFEDRRLWHDPRHRQCSLASVTSLVFERGVLIAVSYTEPAGDLVAESHGGVGA